MTQHTSMSSLQGAPCGPRRLARPTQATQTGGDLPRPRRPPMGARPHPDTTTKNIFLISSKILLLAARNGSFETKTAQAPRRPPRPEEATQAHGRQPGPRGNSPGPRRPPRPTQATQAGGDLPRPRRPPMGARRNPDTTTNNIFLISSKILLVAATVVRERWRPRPPRPRRDCPGPKRPPRPEETTQARGDYPSPRRPPRPTQATQAGPEESFHAVTGHPGRRRPSTPKETTYGRSTQPRHDHE